MVTTDSTTISPASPTLAGHPAAAGVGRGRARRLRSAEDLTRARPGEVLLFVHLPASWVRALPTPAAVVAEQGGALCNAATLLRELGVPAVFGVPAATELVEEGHLVEVDGLAGSVRILAGPTPWS